MRMVNSGVCDGMNNNFKEGGVFRASARWDRTTAVSISRFQEHHL